MPRDSEKAQDKKKCGAIRQRRVKTYKHKYKYTIKKDGKRYVLGWIPEEEKVGLVIASIDIAEAIDIKTFMNKRTAMKVDYEVADEI